MAQMLEGYAVGLLSTHLHHVGIVDGALAEDDKQHDEGDQRDEQVHPVAGAAKEELVDRMLVGCSLLDGMNVLVLHVVEALR